MDILKERRDFYAERNQRYTDLIRVWHGELGKLYPGEFTKGELPKVANFVKSAWDLYASMCGKVPDKVVRPASLTETSQKRASRVEQIATAYDEGSRIKWFTFIHFWYLVGLGSSSRGVVPNFVTKMPQFVVEDPRNVYPSPSFESNYITRADQQGVLSGVTNPDNLDYRNARGGAARQVWSGGQLEDVVIEKRATIRALKRAFPDRAALLGPDTSDNDRKVVHLVQYFDTQSLVTLALGRFPIELGNAYHYLDACPWRVTQTFAPDQVGGISQFEEQVGLLVAYARILSQKLAYNDETVWGLNWVSGDVSSIRVGPHEFVKLDEGGKMGRISPNVEFQADRDLVNLERSIRSLNRESEPLRGEVQGGPITGRGLEQLLAPSNTIVASYWNIDSPDTEALYSYALAIDEAFWPDERKHITGQRRGEQFESSYVPSKDIAGHRDIGIDYGFGVGGVEGLVQALQAQGANLVDRRTVMESLASVQSVNDTLRRIEMDRLDDSIYAAFEGGDLPRAQFLAKVREEVAKGTPLSEAVIQIPAPTPPEQQAQGLGQAVSLLGPESQAAALEAGGAPQGAPPALGELLAQVAG